MAYTVFVDESGTHPGSPCYGIGALVVHDDYLNVFIRWFSQLRLENGGIDQELKWERIASGYGAMNVTVRTLYAVAVAQHVHYHAMIVRKDQYRLWAGSAIAKEEAFYKTLSFLLADIAGRYQAETRVYFDQRSDSYDKRGEVVGIVANRMLSKVAKRGSLSAVTSVNSRMELGIQAADVLTGAFTTGHALHLEPEMPVHAGKVLCLKYMARVLGWDGLHHDTGPDVGLNIWHFPTEYRGPTTEWIKVVRPPARIDKPTLRAWLETVVVRPP
jgi:hypothetical protein